MRSRLSVPALLSAIVLTAFWPITLFLKSMKWDYMDLGLPWRNYVGECIQNGILPLWNPFQNFGFPQMGHFETWYPISWLVGGLFGYDMLSVQYEYLLHIAIAGIGMYLLAGYWVRMRPTRLFAAIAYMLSGFFLAHAQHSGYWVAAAWLPWIVYCALEFTQQPRWRFGIGLALTLMLSLSGGYPGITVTTMYIVLAIGAFRLFYFFRLPDRQGSVGKWLGASGLVGIGFALLSAVVIVASFDMQPHINRGEPLPYTDEVWGILSGSLPGEGIAGFLFPLAAGYTKPNWGVSLSLLNSYSGLLPLVLLLPAVLMKNWRPKVLVAVAVLFLMVAMAKVFPIRYWLYELLPYFNYFRFSALFRVFTTFFLVLASAFAFEALLKQQVEGRRLYYGVAALAILIVIVASTQVLGSSFQGFDLWAQKGYIAFRDFAPIADKVAFQACLHLLILTMIVLAWWRLSGKIRAYSLVAILTIDLLLAVNLNLDGTVLHEQDPAPVNNWIAQQDGAYPLPNLSMAMVDQNDKTPPLPPFIGRNINCIRKMVSSDGYGPYGLKILDASSESGVLLDSVTPVPAIERPLLYTASDVIVRPIPPVQALKDLIPDSSEYREVQVSQSQLDRAPSIITIQDFTPNHLECTVAAASQDKWLIYQQNAYPGWAAMVNGKPQKVITVDYAFLAIPLEAGSNTVVFEFSAPSVKAAFWVSALSLLLSIALLVALSIKRKSN